ncbi:type II toxin-antitoxin system HipA family toxin [Arhodomonas sp. SL1]|uniref:type II toxin-antitoxin system HipA family toxin n=1 Tax=Arhodomonas sp. SL1 TaxID=3425691 RepID=UPI003F881A33
MIHLHAWLRLPDNSLVPAGEIVVADPDRRGRLQGEFRYKGEYLRHPGAFALDPAHLPLEMTSPVPADDPRSGLHGAFRDALPDAWGQRLLTRRHRLGPGSARPPQLLALLGSRGLGALRFTTDSQPPPAAQGGVPIRRLGELMAATRRLDQRDIPDLDEDAALALLFRAGSSLGGARPKALVRDGETEFIAKFAAPGDRYALVPLEAATLSLARQARLTAPASFLKEIDGELALLIERFDLSPEGGRYHMISFQTLLGYTEGWYALAYADLADPLRRHSATPSTDLPALYRQAVFNAAIGNTDDHLKNFSLFHTETGWHLTPAYDLTPNTAGNLAHVLSFANTPGTPDLPALLDTARGFGISTRRARSIVREVVNAVSQWRDTFAENHVPGRDIDRFGNDIDARLRRLSEQS